MEKQTEDAKMASSSERQMSVWFLLMMSDQVAASV